MMGALGGCTLDGWLRFSSSNMRREGAHPDDSGFSALLLQRAPTPRAVSVFDPRGV